MMQDENMSSFEFISRCIDAANLPHSFPNNKHSMRMAGHVIKNQYPNGLEFNDSFNFKIRVQFVEEFMVISASMARNDTNDMYEASVVISGMGAGHISHWVSISSGERPWAAEELSSKSDGENMTILRLMTNHAYDVPAPTRPYRTIDLV